MNLTQRAILKTLAYSDIFDYPLTKSELFRWLIWPHKSEIPTLTPTLKKIPQTGSYFHLPGRHQITKLRPLRARASLKKLALARSTVRWFKLIPTIKMVVITGALSMNNSDKDDDIDLMIVTKTNYLWLTRLFTILILELLRLRRRPQARSTTNKICLNLFLDESALILPKSRRHLYTAHEICQIKPLLNRGETYQNFLSLNSWVKNYLPFAIKIPPSQFPPPPSSPPASLLERFAYKFQLSYMKKKRTRERITFHSAFFHPRPTSNLVLKKYRQKLKELKINEKN